MMLSESKIQKDEGLRYHLRAFLKRLAQRERDHSALTARMEDRHDEDEARNYAHGWVNGAIEALRAVEDALGARILEPKERLTTPEDHIQAAVHHLQGARGLNLSQEAEGFRTYLLAMERDLQNVPRVLDVSSGTTGEEAGTEGQGSPPVKGRAAPAREQRRLPRFRRFSKIATTPDGFEGFDRETRFRASFNLFLIREAWLHGSDLDELADGFGPGMGTMGGDWSGIRDSTPEAKTAMLERALNFLFG